MFGVRSSLIAAEKALLIRNDLAGIVVATNAMIAICHSWCFHMVQPASLRHCLVHRYFTRFSAQNGPQSSQVFLSFLCCLSLVSYYKKNWWRKYSRQTDRLCSMNRWRHNNDAIIKNFYMYVHNNSRYRRFHVSRINGMAPCCNLLSNDPRS